MERLALYLIPIRELWIYMHFIIFQGWAYILGDILRYKLSYVAIIQNIPGFLLFATPYN